MFHGIHKLVGMSRRNVYYVNPLAYSSHVQHTWILSFSFTSFSALVYSWQVRLTNASKYSL